MSLHFKVYDSRTILSIFLAASRTAESPMSSGGKEWKPTQTYVVNGDADLKAFNEFLFKRVRISKLFIRD